jgi:cell division protein FtsZ
MVKLKIIGVGGAGCNAISRLKRSKIEGAELIAINTDVQHLSKTFADFKLQIGKKITQGLGTGMKPEIGEAAAKEEIEQIKRILDDTHILFLVFGGGGGTGSGATPVIAQIAKEKGILIISFSISPFSFEGKTRGFIAKKGIEKVRSFVDGMIVIDNDKLLKTLPPKTLLSEAFYFSDLVLKNSVLAIFNLLTKPSLINVNFSDVYSILKGAGNILIGMGKGKGENRVEEALNSALSFPLVSFPQKKAKNSLFFLEGKDISIEELKKITQMLSEKIEKEGKIVFGLGRDSSLKEKEISLTIFLSGF